MNPRDNKRQSRQARPRGGQKPAQRSHRSGGSQRRSGGQRFKTAYIVLTVIAAIIVVGFVAFQLFTAAPDTGKLPGRNPQTTTIIDADGNEIEVEKPALSADRKKGFYTFLLVGQDTFGGGNTDTMMLVAYNVPEQQLRVMSLPRDTFVELNGRNVLLNSVYNRAGGGEDGIELLKEEVGQLTGVTPDFHVIVQWSAVGTLVDAIDGVYFDVPRRMYYNDLTQDFKIDLQPGYQLLDGDKAMQLIRWRHNSDDNGHILNSGYATGDLGRIKTQQEFMKAVIAKCLQPEVMLSNLADYIHIFSENVITDLTTSNMAYFAKSAVGKLNMDDVQLMTLPNKNAGDGAHVLPVADQLLEAINEGFNPYLEPIRLSELQIVTSIKKPERPQKPSKPEPSGEPAEPAETPVQPEPSEPTATEPPVEPTPSPSMEPEPVPSAEPTPSQQPEPSAVPAETPAPSPEPEPTPAVSPDPDPVTGPGMEPVE